MVCRSLNNGSNNNNGISLSPDLNSGVLTFHGKLGRDCNTGISGNKVL